MVRYSHLYSERRPLVKLKKGIVFGGGRKLALAVCLVALAGAAHATTYYSGKGGSDGSLSQAVTWYEVSSWLLIVRWRVSTLGHPSLLV